jgi:hypothetical protein
MNLARGNADRHTVQVRGMGIDDAEHEALQRVANTLILRDLIPIEICESTGPTVSLARLSRKARWHGDPGKFLG